jgi:GT2 family glycosyltransferase
MREVGKDLVMAGITVIVPVYNTPVEYLDQCWQSLVRQTVTPYDVLIVDDGSTLPATRAWLTKLEETTSVWHVRNERNLGLGPTMNRALRLCSSDFVLKLDSDDIARPQLIERMEASLAVSQEFDVLGCQIQAFGLTNFTTAHPEWVMQDYVLSHYWFVNHTGVLLNRKSVLAVGGYRRLRGLAEDYELWLRMMQRGYSRFYNLPDVLVDYRDSPASLHRAIRGKLNRAMRIWLRLRLSSTRAVTGNLA